MRRSFLAFAITLSCAALSYACEDDSAGGASGSFDGGTGGFDAATPTPDDAAPPVAKDAGPADAEAPSSVTVRVTVLGQPAADRLVVFHDATGAPIGSVKTGADGRATSTGAVPAMATALLGRGNQLHAITWTQVAAGDELLAEDSADNPPSTPTLDVGFPLVDAAQGYDVHVGPCQDNGPSSPVRVFLSYRECQKPSIPVLARMSTTTDVRFAFNKAAATPTDGGAGALTLGAFALATTASVDATSGPNEDGQLIVGLTEIAGGIGFTVGPSLTVDGPRNFQVPNGFADARQVYASFDAYATSSHQAIVRRGAPSATNVIDFAQRLPKITSVDLPELTDPRRFEISWTSEAALSAADGGLVRVRFYRPDFDGNLAWSFVVSPGAANTGKIKAPELPPAAAGWGPASADAGVTSFDLPDALFVDLSTVPSYAAFRRVAATVVEKDGYGPRELSTILPQDGTLRATSYWNEAR